MVRRWTIFSVALASFFLYAKPVFACNPPASYSGCPTSPFGTNGVQLMDSQYNPITKDMQTLRTMADQNGAAGQRIQATIILTDGTISNYNTTMQILNNAEQFGIDVTIRTWGNSMDQSVAQQMGQNLSKELTAFQAATGQTVRVELGNEPNEDTTGAAYAQIFATFAQNCQGCSVYLPSLGGQGPTTMQNYDQFVSQFFANPAAAQAALNTQGIIFNSYGSTPQTAITDWMNALKSWETAANNAGVALNFNTMHFFLTETGPPGGALDTPNLDQFLQGIADQYLAMKNSSDPVIRDLFSRLDGLTFFVWDKNQHLILVFVDPVTGKITKIQAGTSNNIPGSIPLITKAVYCEPPGYKVYPDESLETCPGTSRCPPLKPGQNDETGKMPIYTKSDGSSVNEMRSDANFQFGMNQQGLACGQARSDSLNIHEVANFDLFAVGQPEFCEGQGPDLITKHEWIGESMPVNVNIPFAEYLADHWAGTFDAEHHTEAEIDSLRRLADMQNVKTDADLYAAYQAKSQIWRETGVVNKLLPQYQLDELKAGFIRYIKYKGGKSLYANFAINGTPLDSLDDPPIKPDSYTAAADPSTMRDYTQKLTAWAAKYRNILDYMAPVPNEQMTGQIKLVVCGDREYTNESFWDYPEAMRLGLSANAMFSAIEPQKSKDALYAKLPTMGDPYKYLTDNYVTQNSGSNKLSDLYSSKAGGSGEPTILTAAAPNYRPVVPAAGSEANTQSQTFKVELYPSLLTRVKNLLSAVFNFAGPVAEAQDMVRPEVTPHIFYNNGQMEFYVTVTNPPYIEDDTQISLFIDGQKAGDSGYHKILGLGNSNTFGSNGSGAQYTFANGLPMIPGHTYQLGWKLTENYQCVGTKAQCANFSGSTADNIAVCSATVSSDGTSVDTKCGGTPLPPAPSGHEQFPICDFQTACCVTPVCQPREFPNVRYGPPLTKIDIGLGDFDYGVDQWPTPIPPDNPVRLIFKKQDWRPFSNVMGSLPAYCNYGAEEKCKDPLDNSEGPCMCHTNSDGSNWGNVGGGGCNGDGHKAQIVCSYPYNRDVDIYNNVPFLYSVWQQIAGRTENGFPAGILTLLKPQDIPASNTLTTFKGVIPDFSNPNSTPSAALPGGGIPPSGTGGSSGGTNPGSTGSCAQNTNSSWPRGSAPVSDQNCRYIHGDPSKDPNLNPMANQSCTPLGAGSLGLCKFGYPEGEPPDQGAPQLNGVVGTDPGQKGAFYGACKLSGGRWEASFLGLSAPSCAPVAAPPTGHHAGGDAWDYHVLYADAHNITLANTAEDANDHDIANHCDAAVGSYVINGYSVHLTNLDVDKGLLAEYQKDQAAGRHVLPAVKAGDILGWSLGQGPMVGWTDSDDWMDPRSMLDVWHDFTGAPTVACKGSVGGSSGLRSVAGTGCTTDPNLVFGADGHYLPTPGAAKVDWGYFTPWMMDTPKWVVGMQDPGMTSPAQRNLLFYRLGGVCNADKWYSERALNSGVLGVNK